MRSLLYFLLFISLTLPTAASATVHVTASIKPIHSLVASITRGITQPDLLLDSTSDPHHFSMRPSQRRLIANADLIVWVGPQLEAALSKAIQASPARKLTLLQTDLPVRLAARTHAHGNAHHSDPHVWLSPTNAEFILKQIAQTLIEIDPPNRRMYQTNLDKALAKLHQLNDKAKAELNLPQKTYIAYHDAYQYFEHEFGLQLAGAIKTSDTSKIGARQLSQLHRLVRQQQVNCIIYDAQSIPDIINNFPRTGKTRIQRIDILGTDIPAGDALWFSLIQQLSDGFHQCLQ